MSHGDRELWNTLRIVTLATIISQHGMVGVTNVNTTLLRGTEYSVNGKD